MGMPKGTILGETAEREPASAPGNNIHKPNSITVFDRKTMILSMEDSSRKLTGEGGVRNRHRRRLDGLKHREDGGG